MSSLSTPLASAGSAATHTSVLLGRAGVAVAAGAVLALVLTLPKAIQVATTGIFLNPDDAMRAVEMRDFMAGQPWFDLVPHRLSPDHPFVMHWSRLIDLPLAVVTWIFGWLLPPASAELAMRLLVPSLLFLGALALMVVIVRDLIGPRAMLPSALLLGGSSETVANFIPGHIHHHAAQATLLLLATKLLLDALKPGASWRPAAGAGVAAAVSLGIGLQNLPFVIGLGAIAGCAWVLGGGRTAPLLAGFGGGLSAASAVVFGLDVPPSSYGAGACDAFSTAHLLMAGLGGGLAILLAAASRQLATPVHRGSAAAVAGAILVGLVHLAYPACLRDPMAGVDPLLRERWLADVGEALPLGRLIAVDWSSGLPLALTLLWGLAASLAAWASAPRGNRMAWAALLGLAAVGAMGTLYQVRVAASAVTVLVPGVTWAVLRTFDRLSARPGRPALLAATVVGLLGNGAGWTALAAPLPRLFALPASHDGVTAAAAADPASCFEPARYDALKALPPGLVLSTIDPGSAILAATPHAVLAAPYHRNTFGNRVALRAFDASPDEAQKIVSDARATYVVLCRASNEAADSMARHPDGLAAALLRGHPPAWLLPLGTGQEPILLFKVAP